MTGWVDEWTNLSSYICQLKVTVSSVDTAICVLQLELESNH